MADGIGDDAIRAAGGATKADLANLHQKLNQRDAALQAMQNKLQDVTVKFEEAEIARRLSNLPEDQAEVERLKIDKERAEAKVAELEAKAGDAATLVDKIGRIEAAKQYGQKYGVEYELLLGAATPEAMESQAKKIRDSLSQRDADVKAQVAAALKAAGFEPKEEGDVEPADDAGGGGGPKKVDLSQFEHSGDVGAALTAMRKAGSRK